MRILLSIAVLFTLALPAHSVEIASEPDYTLLVNRVDAVRTYESFAVAITGDALTSYRWDADEDIFVPETVTQLNYSPARIEFVDSVGLVTSDDYDIIGYNLKALPEIEELWRVSPGIEFSDFALWDDRLYLSSWYDGLWRFDISDGDAVFVDSSMVGILLSHLSIVGDNLYALDEYNGIMKYALTDTGFAAFQEYLYVPREIKAFVPEDSNMTMLAREGNIVLGAFSGSGASVTDSIPEMSPAQRVFVTDEKVVAVSPRQIEIIDRLNTGDIVSVVVDPVGPDGDLFEFDGQSYVLLPRTGGGMVIVHVDQPGLTGPGAYRSGPIEALAIHEGRIFTGGGANPIDAFVLDSVSGPVLTHTMYPGLTDAQDLMIRGDTLIAYYAGSNRVAFIQDALDPDSFYIERTFHLQDTLAGELLYWEGLEDSLRFLLATADLSIQPYAISDSGIISPLESWPAPSRIADVAVADSFLFIGTTKRQLVVYHIDANYYPVELNRIDLPGVPTEILWRDNRLVVFSSEVVTVFERNETGFVSTGSAIIGFQVTDAVFANEKLYTVGGSGIGVFNADSVLPELLTLGGLPGRYLAVESNLLATTDGGSVLVYKLEADTPGPGQVLPDDFVLHQNYPNPFNASTVIEFAIPKASRVELTIYNTLGREVKTLLDADRAAGRYIVRWDGTNGAGQTVASGVYLYRLQAGEVDRGMKMLLLK